MSFRRKKYDGDFSGGSSSAAERRDPFYYESSFNQYAASKRAGTDASLEHSLFNEESDKDRYIITYADLITLLLGLFILLYAISNVDNAKYQKLKTVMSNIFGNDEKPDGIIGLQNKKFEIKDEIVELQQMKENLQNVINTYKAESSVKLEENERGITIRILGDILFPSGTADLNENSKLMLKQIASIIKILPNDIRVEGHTDNRPMSSSLFRSNWHLSVERALNTAYYLINEEGLPPEKVSIVGFSEYRPVESNETPDGRKTNRRVDITILKK